MKKGLLSVFNTSATRGRPSGRDADSRLQAVADPKAASSRVTRTTVRRFM